MEDIQFCKHFFQRKIVNIFLLIIFNICFWCLKELSQWDGSFEYPQHMFWLINKKTIWLVPEYKFNIFCYFCRMQWKILKSVNNFFQRKIVNIFLHMFWVFKRTASLRRFL